MDFGKVEYMFYNPKAEGGSMGMVRLTLIGQNDDRVLKESGLVELRRKRIIRLTNEAKEQGSLLGFDDLSSLLLTSLATLKRDVSYLEGQGCNVPMRGRRNNGNGTHAASGRLSA